MKYLLDTCVISELIKKEPNRNVTQWIQSVDEQELYLSALTFGEIQNGIERLPNGLKKNRLTLWLEDDLKRRFSGRIISIDLHVSVVWGRTQAQSESMGKPMPAIDGLIAASALANNCIVVTRNTSDMKNSGVDLINPWD